MKQDEVVPVINRAGDRTLLLSDGRLGRFVRIPRIMHLFFPFQGARLPFTPASIEPFCRPVQRRGRVTARPVFARPFFLAESDPAVLLSCQTFLHAHQIALAGTLNNPQQLSHRGDPSTRSPRGSTLIAICSVSS
jgi:hypothetical protein